MVHACLSTSERVAGVLPGDGAIAVRIVRDQLGPLLEDRGDPGVGPMLLAGQQVHMELVAVEAQVQHVERAHRRPTVHVAKGNGSQLVLLHPRTKRQQLIPCGRHFVAVCRPDALAVEHRPGVGVDGDAVDPTVISADRADKTRSEVVLDQGPDFVDRRDQALLGEVAHPISGAPGPGEEIVGRAVKVGQHRVAAEVGADVSVGVERVQGGPHASELLAGGVDRIHAGLFGRVGIVSQYVGMVVSQLELPGELAAEEIAGDGAPRWRGWGRQS